MRLQGAILLVLDPLLSPVARFGVVLRLERETIRPVCWRAKGGNFFQYGGDSHSQSSDGLRYGQSEEEYRYRC